MNFYLDNKLIIEQPTQELLEWVEATLTFPNTDYLKKEAMGLWTGNIDKDIVLYERVGDTLLLPFGIAEDVYKLFYDKFNIVENKITPIRARNYQSRINTYPYQEIAVERLKSAKNGVLVAPCGSGKTQMGLELVARIGGRALWLTHTQDLLRQSMERALANFDLPQSEYGTITSGRVNIGNTITFATVQTMAKIDLTSLKNYFDIIIIDECGHLVGTPTNLTMFYKVVSSLSARYKIGLTATPYRSDGLEKSMYAIIGNIKYRVSKKDVKNNTCPIKIKQLYTDYQPDLDVVLAGDGTLEYTSLISDLTHNKYRNAYINAVINKISGATLVLSDRVEHLTILKDMCNKKCKHLIAQNTKKAKEERKKILEELNNGELDVVFATYKLAKEGLDIPNLKYIVLATPQKDKATIVQSCGRVGRKGVNKECGYVIDIVDNFGMFMGWARKRKSYYKQNDYEIIV